MGNQSLKSKQKGKKQKQNEIVAFDWNCDSCRVCDSGPGDWDTGPSTSDHRGLSLPVRQPSLRRQIWQDQWKLRLDRQLRQEVVLPEGCPRSDWHLPEQPPQLEQLDNCSGCLAGQHNMPGRPDLAAIPGKSVWLSRLRHS